MDVEKASRAMELGWCVRIVPLDATECATCVPLGVAECALTRWPRPAGRIPPPASHDGRASWALSCWRDEACVDGDVTFGPGKALTNDSGDGTTQLIVRERRALGLQAVERDLRHVIAAN